MESRAQSTTVGTSMTSLYDNTLTFQMASHVKAVNNKHIVRNMQAIITFHVKSDNFERPQFSCSNYQVSVNTHSVCFETEQYSNPFQHSSIT